MPRKTDMFNEMYFDELNQLIDLRNLIGVPVPVVSRQTINLLGTSAPNVAFVAPPATTTLTPAQAISMARMFEDLSASAFAGAIVYLSGTNRSYAAQVLAADGFHAGAVRLVSIQNAAPYQAAEYLLPFTGTTTSGSPTIPALLTTTGGRASSGRRQHRGRHRYPNERSHHCDCGRKHPDRRHHQ